MTAQPLSDTPYPAGPYFFDDISNARQDDGLGYVYLVNSPSGLGPTLAHTGDRALTPEQNRALGNLFAAAPALLDALTDLIEMYTAYDAAAKHTRSRAETFEIAFDHFAGETGCIEAWEAARGAILKAQQGGE